MLIICTIPSVLVKSVFQKQQIRWGVPRKKEYLDTGNEAMALSYANVYDGHLGNF